MSKVDTLLISFIKQFEAENIDYYHNKGSDYLALRMLIGAPPLNQITVYITPTIDGCEFKYVFENLITPHGAVIEILKLIAYMNSRLSKITYSFDIGTGTIAVQHYWVCAMLSDEYIRENCLKYFSYMHQAVANFLKTTSQSIAAIIYKNSTASKEIEVIENNIAKTLYG